MCRCGFLKPTLARAAFYSLSRRFSAASTKVESDSSKRNHLFEHELRRQRDVGRLEKIQVDFVGHGKKSRFLMNKHLSTPYDIARHVSEWASKQSALAIINDKTLWDMNRPLDYDCSLEFLTFTDNDPFHVNKAFWRTCSFLLGAVIQNAFDDHINVVLHSFPSPAISSGSFIYDAFIQLEDWKPTVEELRVLSSQMLKLSHKEEPIERLQVNEDLAKEMFSDNQFKLKQIPDIAKNSEGNITLYRAGQHIDISKGPMVGNTSFLGRCSVTAVHKIESEDGPLYRFQGVALPRGLLLNSYAYQILEDRAKKLVFPNVRCANVIDPQRKSKYSMIRLVSRWRRLSKRNRTFYPRDVLKLMKTSHCPHSRRIWIKD